MATGTTAFAPRRVDELSDGERQKVLRARAGYTLAAGPEALAKVVVRGAPEAYGWALTGPSTGDTGTTVAALLAALRAQLAG